MQTILFGCAFGCLGALPNPTRAEDIATIQVVIRDHRFIPAEIHVLSGKPTFLEIVNNDPTPEEFESGVLAIEKVITGGGHARIRLRPLAPGQYKFIGEFHPDTASGVIVSAAGSSPPS
jgi:hypothetical protein